LDLSGAGNRDGSLCVAGSESGAQVGAAGGSAFAGFDWVGWGMGRNWEGTGEVWMVGNVEQAAAAGNLGLNVSHPIALRGIGTLFAWGNN